MRDYHFSALADERRRELVRALLADSSHSLDSGSERDSERAVSLHHVHLPVLESAGLVEWDRETGVLTRGPEFDVLEPVTDHLRTAPTAGAD